MRGFLMSAVTMVAIAIGSMFIFKLYRWFRSLKIPKGLTIIRPEALVSWHRADFRRLGGTDAKDRSSKGLP